MTEHHGSGYGLGFMWVRFLLTHCSHWVDWKAFPDGIYGVKFKTGVLCTTMYGYNRQSI